MKILVYLFSLGKYLNTVNTVLIITASVLFAVAVALIVYTCVKAVKKGEEYPISKEYWSKVFYFYTEEERKKDKGKASVYCVNFALPEKKPFILICPGGGYGGVSMDWEGTPVAEQVNACGYSAFVLKYRVGKYATHPNPQDDVACALKYIFDHAEELNVEVENYAIMGFSAGGHLAGSFCTKNVGYKKYGIKAPQTAILVYPVLTMGEFTHRGTKNNLIGERAPQELIDEWSVEKHVDGDFPPTFMWGRDEDVCSYKGDLLFKKRMEELGIDIVHEVYAGKEHGEALGIGKPMEGWVARAVAFWKGHMKK